MNLALQAPPIRHGFRLAALSAGLLLLATPLPAAPQRAARPPERVTLALKWYHQFQFAGYYAAQAKGFYAEEGLEVELREPTDKRLPVEVLLAGEAEYGVSAADLLKARAAGAPLVVLAAIFQHSPIVLVSRADRAIRNPVDLAGRTVMIGGNDLPEIQAMLVREGVPLGSVTTVPHSWRLDEVLEGKVDAVQGYITDEPNLMRQRGVQPAILRPIDYGIDFYGDTLFTSQAELKRHPARVAAFRRASLKGWDYAMQHVDELVPLILALPGVQARGITAEHLRREAGHMASLVQSDLIEIGHLNRGRWQRMADTYVELGLLPAGFTLDEFLYNPTPAPRARLLCYVLAGVILGILLVGGLALVWNLQLRAAVRRQTYALVTSRQSYEDIYNSVSEAIYIQGENGVFIDVNRGATDMYGYTRAELIGKTPADLAAPGRNDLAALTLALQRVFQTGEPARFEFWAVRKNGEVFPKEVIVNKGGYFGQDVLIATARDISGQKRAEEERGRFHAQLTQAHKMESIGRLAGGIAHDFNNMLNVISGRAEIAMDKIPPTHPAHGDLQEISRAASRSTDLTRRLLAFARKQAAAPRVLDLNDTVAGMLIMLRRLIGENVQLAWRPAPTVWPLRVDPAQIDQILANLCVNARDAIRETGVVTIETANATLDADFCARHRDAKPGEYVRLSVADNGRGMGQDVLAHLFEPFFTTKDTGQGIGLGLALVYGFVRQNDGFIVPTSAPGHGTCFDLYLPRHTGPLSAETPAPPAPTTFQPRCILVVEDEPAVLQLCRTVLKRRGHRVLAAQTAEEALRLAGAHAKEVDLLLTDIVMPGMNGWELAQRLRASHPHIRALFMSGYTADVLSARGIEQADLALLQKPFANGDLLAKVESMWPPPPSVSPS